MADDKLRLFLWSLAGAGFLSLIGAAFGAIAGVVARKHGRQAGGLIGNAVAGAVARVSDHELSDTMAGASGRSE